MSYEMPAPDVEAELENLVRMSANSNLQTEADLVHERMKQAQNDERYSSSPDTTLRATSPHVLLIHNHFDRMIHIYDEECATSHVQLVPTTRETSTFVFNIGIDILAQTLNSGTPLPDKTARKVLDRLEVGEIYYDHGDFPGWMGMSRIDEAGSMFANIDNDKSMFSRAGKLSALFMEKAEQGRSVDHAAMTGLWALALALKIQQKARENHTVYNLLNKGLKLAGKPLTFENLPSMLLKLDR